MRDTTRRTGLPVTDLWSTTTRSWPNGFGGTSGGGGDGGGAATCPCTPDGGSDLTVVVCTELNCGAEVPKFEITVCGGTPPYSWVLAGASGSPTIVQSGANNRNAVVTPISSEDDFPGQTAFAKVSQLCRASAGDCCGFTFNLALWANFDCANQQLGSCQTAINVPANPANCNDGAPATHCLAGDCAASCTPPDNNNCNTGLCGGSGPAFKDTSECVVFSAGEGGVVCDKRSQEMKDAGSCLPCSMQLDRATITVTDDIGTQVVTVIKA